ncbi:MAG: hypothetical protein ACLPVF_16285 [Acidimicrobiales bacterium]
MHDQPQGAAFDIVLLLHVACVLAGLATSVAAAATATRLRRHLRSGSPIPDAVLRYFRPGVNWAGRTLWGIPVFGFALLAMSGGVYALSDAWVAEGLAIFVVVAGLGEGVLWPTERRLQRALAERAAAVEPGGTIGKAGTAGEAGDPSLVRATTAMSRAGYGAVVLLVLGMVIMLVQP